jgi:hypothetical protein
MPTNKELLILWVILAVLIYITTPSNNDIDTCAKAKNGYSKETCLHLLNR